MNNVQSAVMIIIMFLFWGVGGFGIIKILINPFGLVWEKLIVWSLFIIIAELISIRHSLIFKKD